VFRHDVQPVVRLAFIGDHPAVESQSLLEHRNLEYAPEPFAVFFRQFALRAAREAHHVLPGRRDLLAAPLDHRRQRAQHVHRSRQSARAELP